MDGSPLYCLTTPISEDRCFDWPGSRMLMADEDGLRGLHWLCGNGLTRSSTLDDIYLRN
jgi:hypothetical protein